jgi:AraC-like DNA-binding protein
MSGEACRKVILADASCAPDPASSLAVGARLVLVVAGERELRCARAGQVLTQRLAAGDALFATPGSWLLSTGRWRYELLTLSIQPEFLRAFHRPLRRYDSPAPPTPAAWYHTAGPPSAMLADQVRMLGALLGQADGGESALHLARAVLAGSLVEIGRDRASAGARADQAQRSWHLVRSYLEEHAHRDIGRGEVARATGLSPGHITRLFARYGDGGFSQHLTRLRLTRACQLLRATELSVAEVAAACGMIPHRLIRQFKANLGTTPGRYRTAHVE